MPKDFELNRGTTTIAGTTHGTGDSIIFLHAGVADRRMWDHQVGYFGENHKAIAYDRRGFGKTTANNEPFRHVDDLEAILNHLGLKETAICGCSQGARIAIDYALEQPDRVSALVLVSATYTGADWSETTDRESELVRSIDRAEANGDIDLVNKLEAHMWLDGPATKEGRANSKLRKLFLEMNGLALKAPELTNEIEPPTVNGRLSNIDCPTLLVNGELDFELIGRRHTELHREISNSHTIQMDDTAHLPPLEHPTKFNTIMQDFLRSL